MLFPDDEDGANGLRVERLGGLLDARLDEILELRVRESGFGRDGVVGATNLEEKVGVRAPWCVRRVWE